MPSRKKAKGKLRKAKAASKCNHGFPQNDGEVSKIVSLLLSDFKSALSKVTEDLDCPTSGYKCVCCRTQNIYKQFRCFSHLYSNVPFRNPQFGQRHPQGEKVV